jgi:Transposase DDE domain
MSVPSHHTAPTPPVPVSPLASETWATEIVPRLPATLDQQARTLKAFQRIRGINCPTDLLRAILAYVLDAGSFRLLGVWAVLLGLADISDTAWRNRLRRASPWLAWLIGELLAAAVTTAPDLALRKRRIRLVDATRLAQLGGSGDDWRVHLVYDLVAARMGQVVVTDQHGAEQLAHFEPQPGDILVGDCGYGYRKNVAFARTKQADTVLRVYLPTFPVEDADGRPFDAIAWLLAQHGTLAEWSGYCRDRGRRSAVRLIAHKLPPDKVAAARKRKAKKAKKAHRKLTATTVALAGWLVLITTLDVTWPATEVLRLYQARWQIELVFKRIKQLLRLAPLRCQNRDAVQATVRAILVAWALQEQVASEVRALLPSEARDPHAPASSWLLAGLSVQTLRQTVRGSWSVARIHDCRSQLERFLVTSPRKRCQTEAATRAWLEDRLRTVQPLLELHDGRSIGKVQS